ncbi:Dual specificity protein phosphatase PPS1 [Sphaceloma murrayae]|uniref:Dual specificity protein phosphatase PPS1 n=1 Tax=Sphaceloma murrayae TaxID=2082308 RepID=A0A2K1QUP3_9PEZI|nr:Dual specificity protein phosphatase PPS1 [Sphaceloma murrayae]
MSTVMATVVTRPASLTKSASPPSTSLSLNTSVRGTPSSVPNKHLPYCSPGPRPAGHRLSSPGTPTTPSPALETSTLLCPPDDYPKLSSRPPVYSLDSTQLHRALDHIASQPLPDPKLVFPWLHGLHPENSLQLAFFIARKKALRRVPKYLRSITVVKAGGDLSCSKIRGAVTPEELLCSGKMSEEPQFLDADPRDGFSVRNFQIQAAKLATVSDIVVYGDDTTPKEEVTRLAERISRAQKAWREREREREPGLERPTFSTFVLSDTFAEVEQNHAEIVAIGSNCYLTGNVIDFFHQERVEMSTMSAASEIAHNVWLGPTPDSELHEAFTSAAEDDKPLPYDLLIECNEVAQIPNRNAFNVLESLLASPETNKTAIPQLEFPGSGSIMPPTWSQLEADGLIATITWIYKQAHSTSSAVAGADPVSDSRKRKDSKVCLPLDSDGDSFMPSPPQSPTHTSSTGRKFLLHCSDGYTETTLLAVAYYMYAHCVPLHEAYISLHKIHKRNFFAYPTDVALLTAIQPRILSSSPLAQSGLSLERLVPARPKWMDKVDGSLPSRVTEWMYLGNLNHANNPGLLKELGIGQVLSVGESVDWRQADRETFCEGGKWEWERTTGEGRWMFVGGVQDNGVDPLTEEFESCLDFIRKGRERGVATLVHCRVGVSRSATICIAEVMNEFGFSFPRAYCFVRARRLNVIIQPHLRFSYELLKYEEYQAVKRARPFKRELEWATIAREIAAMNRPYSRQ